MDITPLNGHILVQLSTQGDVDEKNYEQATVINAGAIESISVGDTLVFQNHSPIELNTGGEVLHFILEKEIVGIEKLKK